ncbi:GGDEF domain-containing protein [Thermus thermamylovorans]|uniref:GGDEF domain-containing protein n=1 Tax=Thermus thermamylovorans TaxID=2509362 RepID=A0A4Q9B484_9DEIN|nr:GGDEF domain-containing protein [Thermus thermamylovorans]TBH20749.1 GGDEF domain-containing protein [Thermus thermamylovorans]
MVPYGLGFLVLLLFLGLSPLTAPWSQGFLAPAVALGGGGFLLWRGERAWGLGLLLLGLGELARTLGELRGWPRGLYLDGPYLAGYAALTLALLRLPGKRPGLSLLLLPLGLLGLTAALRPELGMDRVYGVWDVLLLALLLPRLEPLFQERFLGGRALWGVGLLLLLVADMSRSLLRAAEDHLTGHPAHLLWSLGYFLLALGVVEEKGEKTAFPGQALALGSLFLMPALLLQGPTPWGVQALALYGGLAGALGLLYAQHLGWRRTEEKGRRWTLFLEELARLSPSVTQTLSPEAVLLGALEAARQLLPQAVGLEVRGRRGLVGERTPHSLVLPLNGDSAYLYLRTPPEEPVPPSFLSLLGERVRQVLKQVEWGTLALTDPLTGLLNRRGLEAELPKLLALARRYGAPVSVVMLDIDRFKRVNDTYGHPVGDEVLKVLGRILGASVRREDLAVRYGGEEFLLLLYGADREAAKEVVERIRYRFRSHRVDPIPYPLTLSAGIAGGEVPEGEPQLEDWILKADYALLRAKEAGRDRVTLA